MSDYKVDLHPLTIHFCDEYPGRKKPVMAVSFAGESAMRKVASFNDEKTMKWFVECLDEAIWWNRVRRTPGETK